MRGFFTLKSYFSQMRLILIFLGIAMSSFCFCQSTKSSHVSEDSISSLTISIIGDSYRVDSVFVSVVDRKEQDTIFGITSSIGECRLNLKKLELGEKREYTILLRNNNRSFKSTDVSFEIEDSSPRDFLIELRLFAQTSCSMVMLPVLFNEGSSELNSMAKDELLVMVDLLKENPSIKIEARGYVDCLELIEFGVELASERAESAKKFLCTNLIDAERIIVTADDRIYNAGVCNCEGGLPAKCTEEQLALKRTISFMITSI